MLGRPTASAIASASMKSFLFVFTNGFTYCGGIKRTYLVSLLLERFGKKMGATACFHANQMDLSVGCEAQQLCSREFLANHNLASLVQTYQMKNRFAKINT